MSIKYYSFLVAIAAAAGPAYPQDGSEMTNARSPENARQFLKQLPEKMFVTAATINGLSMISYRVVSFEHNSDCEAVVAGVPRFYGFNEMGKPGTYENAVDMSAGNPNLLVGKDGVI